MFVSWVKWTQAKNYEPWKAELSPVDPRVSRSVALTQPARLFYTSVVDLVSSVNWTDLFFSVFKKQLPHSNGLSVTACAPPNLFFFQFGQLWLKNFMLYSYSVFLFIFARFWLRGRFAWGGGNCPFPLNRAALFSPDPSELRAHLVKGTRYTYAR